MKLTDAHKQNVALNPRQDPYQIRSKSSEFKYNRSHSGEQSTIVAGTHLPVIPPTLPLFHVASTLQFVYGLRISEVLSILNGDITNEGFVLIKGKKGSNNRIIHSQALLELKHPNPIYDKAQVFPFSYAQYRRVCLRYGISLEPEGNRKRRIITHLYRHNRIKMIYKLVSNDIKDTLKFTGQKNNRSALHYINTIKEN